MSDAFKKITENLFNSDAEKKRFNIILGMPGMGKSLFLIELMKKLNNNSNSEK